MALKAREGQDARPRRKCGVVMGADYGRAQKSCRDWPRERGHDETSSGQAELERPRFLLSRNGRDLRASFARRPEGINPRPCAAGALDGRGYRDGPGVRDSLEPRSRNLSRPAWLRRRYRTPRVPIADMRRVVAPDDAARHFGGGYTLSKQTPRRAAVASPKGQERTSTAMQQCPAPPPTRSPRRRGRAAVAGLRCQALWRPAD
jgi:hypothetical protein